MATHSGILVWRISVDIGAWRAAVHGVAKGQKWLSDEAYYGTGLSTQYSVLTPRGKDSEKNGYMDLHNYQFAVYLKPRHTAKLTMCACVVASVMYDFLQPYGL